MSVAHQLFDPARLPPRERGMTFHPTLDEARWQHPEYEEYLNMEAFAAAGLETCGVEMEDDIPADHPLLKSYFEDGNPDVSEWEPSTPAGDGWLLIAVYDTDDGPHALFVRDAMDARA